MVLKDTFNNISATGYIAAVNFINGGNHRPVTNDWKTLSHNVVSSSPCHKQDSHSQL